MKLYSRDGEQSTVSDPDFGTFTTDEAGVLEGLPDELFARLHSVHVGGRPLWESEEERDARLTAEDDARRRDPLTLLAAVERMGAPRELTAAELREAYEERKRIRDEEEQRELARLEVAELSEAAKADADAAAEALRIAELPVHLGDTVKLTAEALAVVGTQPNGADALLSLNDWRGVVIAVYANDGLDLADVQDDKSPDSYLTAKVSDLVVIDLVAEQAEADRIETERVAAIEKAAEDEAAAKVIEQETADAKAKAPAVNGTAAPKPPAKTAKPTADK